MNLIRLTQPTGCPANIHGCDPISGECMGVCMSELSMRGQNTVNPWRHVDMQTLKALDQTHADTQGHHPYEQDVREAIAWNAANAPRYGFALPAWVRRVVAWWRS